MSDNILNSYNFPPEAVEDLTKRGLVAKQLGNGVMTFEQGGHDKGIAYRFFIEPVVNPKKSLDNEIDEFDNVEMVQWFVNKKHQPVERVEFLPDQLLKFRREKIRYEWGFGLGKPIEPREVIGGAYAEAYKAWKSGIASGAGTQLDRWGTLSPGDCASLNQEGIFTVEQLSSLPENRVNSWPLRFQEAFQSAIKFVNRKNLIDTSIYADQIAMLREEKAKLEQAQDDMREEMKELRAAIKQSAPKRGRPKKETVKDAA